ncbi:hypothetical protein ACWEQ4_14035 [Rhodococcus sp. NPDC003994]
MDVLLLRIVGLVKKDSADPPDKTLVRRVGSTKKEFDGFCVHQPALNHIAGGPAPTTALLSQANGLRPAPESVEWLMGLEPGWVTNPDHGLTDNQQLADLEKESFQLRQCDGAPSLDTIESEAALLDRC